MKALNLSHLSKVYWLNKQQRKVVNDLSLSLDSGKIFGFLGPNGAGKTTTVKMILGLIEHDQGKIELFGKQNLADAKSRIGYMSEHPHFYQYLTGEEMIFFAASLFNLDKALAQERAKKLFQLVDLADAKKMRINSYSKGMNQRLGLICALINDPELIILDEPLDGLDPIGRLLIKKILLEEKRKGKTIFFNSHILADAEEICDEIGIINSGRLIKTGKPKIITQGKTTLEQYFVKLIEQDNEKHV